MEEDELLKPIEGVSDKVPPSTPTKPLPSASRVNSIPSASPSLPSKSPSLPIPSLPITQIGSEDLVAQEKAIQQALWQRYQQQVMEKNAFLVAQYITKNTNTNNNNNKPATPPTAVAIKTTTPPILPTSSETKKRKIPEPISIKPEQQPIIKPETKPSGKYFLVWICYSSPCRNLFPRRE